MTHNTLTVREAKLVRSYEEVERMPRELRDCVHEYGYAIVNACLQAKVTDPRRIHQLVREIWDGARQPSQKRKPGGTVEWILTQAGAGISAATLIRVLDNDGLVIVPKCPSSEMIAASCAEVSGFTERMTKQEKHRRRLTAALRAGASYLAPKLARSA